MIGILCNRKNERTLAKKIHNLMRPFIKRKNIPVIVFCLRDISFAEKTVTGRLVSEKAILTITTDLPFFIVNLAVQYTKTEIKIARKLIETEGISVINIANCFNQWTIMEMLSSDSKTRKHILDYTDLYDQNSIKDFVQTYNFVAKPLKGTNISKVIYSEYYNSGFSLYGTNIKSYTHKLNIDNAIYSIIKNKKLILFKSPALLTGNNGLIIVRVYVQRGFIDSWEILSKMMLSKKGNICDSLNKKLNTSSSEIINCINCYIPDIFICFMDFVVNTDGLPYFIGFGGWDNKLLGKNQSRDVQTKLCKNILEYAQKFIDMQKGCTDNVD